MKNATLDIVTQTYSILMLCISAFIISGVVCIYKRQKLNKCVELEMIMSILYADLFWSVTSIIEDVQQLTKASTGISDVLICIASFFLQVSMSFATLTAYCAFKTLEDPQYLQKSGFYRISLIFGYVCPLLSSLIELTLYLCNIDLRLEFNDTMIKLAYPPIVYSIVCVCLSLYYYISIQRSLSKYKLTDSVKSEINTLFYFPLIILLFVSIPNLCVLIIGATTTAKDQSSNIINAIDIVVIIIIPLYGMVNCWAYGRSIRLLERKDSQTDVLNQEDNLQISLVQSGFGTSQQLHDKE